jgi:tricarballylate dehydrogenase
MVAIDARAPLYDGGICTRVDCVSLGIVVNREAKRFYDEGEDFWPKRYAIWGRLVAQQPGQIGYAIIDAKAVGRFMPPVFPGEKADTLEQLAKQLSRGAGRLRDRGPDPTQDALGAPAGHAAVLRLRGATGRHLYLPGAQVRR